MKIIIDGLWAVGKTTICQHIRDKYGFVYIEEPDHKKENYPILNLDAWYLDKHNDNFDMLLHADNSVAERSAASTFAYIRAIGKSDDYAKSLFDLVDLKKYNKVDKCIILYTSSKTYKCVINDFIYAQDFVEKYNNFLKLYSEELFGSEKVIRIDIDKNIISDVFLKKIITLL